MHFSRKNQARVCSSYKHIAYCMTAKQVIHKALISKRKVFNTLFTLITLHLWNERNARMFRGTVACVNLVIHLIRHEGLSLDRLYVRLFVCYVNYTSALFRFGCFRRVI